jgi:hypothetical protein
LYLTRTIRVDRDPLQTEEITRSPSKAIQTTQDIGYYALGGPNLSKLYVPCTFEFLVLATPEVSLSGHGGKTPTAGTPGKGVHRAFTREFDGIVQLLQHRA